MDDSAVDADEQLDPGTPPGDDVDRDDDVASGFVNVRSALVGLGFIWLTAFAAFGAVVAAVYGATVSIEYLLASIIAAAVAIVAAAGSLRTFGYR